MLPSAPRLTLPPEIPDVTLYLDTTYNINLAASGGASDVWPCTLNFRGPPRKVAVKKLRVMNNVTMEKIAERLIREVYTCNRLQPHPYISELLGVVDIEHGSGRPGIVLPYYENSNALSFIQKGNFSESKKGEIVSNIAEGLKHMHVSCNAVHGDLKLRNILFDNQGVPKICDFGLSRIVDTTGFTTTTTNLSIPYAAPEILATQYRDDDDGDVEVTSTPARTRTMETDIYAFAILTAEIFMEKLHVVTSDNNAWVTYLRIRRNKRPPGDKVSRKYFPLLEDCWKTNPAERLRIDQIVWALRRIERDGRYYDPRRQN
ncbi:kinase-like domain-containing protein [Amanita rubescens]|nr:kinase-like domain-containing protein [Amanita rubescens]